MDEIKIQIPGYELDRLIGRGGMAEVYIARQISLGREVALKILLQTLSPDASFTERFEREAKTAAALQHPNIIKIFDTGLSEGRYYIAMEYLGSRTLRDLIVEGMSPSMAVKYLSKIASALEYAHGKGVIHRDIKPTNILLYADNEPVLSDFGISRLVDSNSTLTATGMMIGSPRYMSPEQAKGAVVDSRSDLYALGVVFYEMLTGTFPYDAEDTLALMYMHVNEAIPELPPALSRYQPIIDALMAKDPDQRLSNAGEILKLLGNELEQTGSFTENSETVFLSTDSLDTSAAKPATTSTHGSPAAKSQQQPSFSAGSRQDAADGNTPATDSAPPAQAKDGGNKRYGLYALLAIVLIGVVGLYQYLAPTVFTSTPPTAPEADSMENILQQLQGKLDAGDYAAARELLERGLAKDALDQRLLVLAERLRVGVEQQGETKDTGKASSLAQEALESAKAEMNSGQYGKARALITEAEELGADPASVDAMERELAAAQETGVRLQQYRTLLVQSRAALENNNYYSAEQAAKEAMILQPESAEIKQLLTDIQRAQDAANRDQAITVAQEKIRSGEYDKALLLIAQAKKLGADETRIAAAERELELAQTLAQEADIQHRKDAAQRNEKLTSLQNNIEQALSEEDIDAARAAYGLLIQENPETSVISQYESLIANKEQELKTRELLDKQIDEAKSLYEQGQLMEGLAAVELALLLDAESDEAQQLLQTIRSGREQKLEALQQEAGSALAGDDLAGSKEALRKLNDLEANAAALESQVAELEQRLAASMLPLTVTPTPADAKIRILNIGPSYQAGMKLTPGTYKIEVSKSGYKQHVAMFELEPGQEIYTVELEEVDSLDTAPIAQAPEKPVTVSMQSFEPEMVKIPGGTFQMGCVIDRGCKHNEKPPHEVQVAAFEIGKYEVTFEQWDACVDDGGCRQRLRDKGWGRGKRPAINVSWNDAQEYVKWLSGKTGKQYRLPSEAEWEYAARAGTTGAFSFNGNINVDKANYDGNYFFDDSPRGVFREQTLPVGSFPPNPWGLYDMHGNVWEWTLDCMHENYEGAPATAEPWVAGGDCSKRGLRGGSWNSAPGNLRSSNRGWFLPARRYYIDGFRVVRTLAH